MILGDVILLINPVFQKSEMMIDYWLDTFKRQYCS